MKNTRITIIAAFILVLCASCSKEETYLRYKLREGNTYLLRMQSEQNIQQTVLKQTIGLKTNMDMTMRYVVTGMSDSVYALQVSYEKIAMEMELPQGAVKYDSESDDTTDVLNSVMKGLTGMKFTVNMQKTGKIVSIEGLGDLLTDLAEAMPENRGQYKEQIDQMMKNYIGEDAVTRNLSMGVPVFSEEAVSQGEDWELNTRMKSFLSGELRTTYQLEELTSNKAIILGDAYFDVQADSADLMMTGVELNYDVKGPVESRYLIDLENGWIDEGAIDQKLSGTVSMPPSKEMPEGMTIEMNIESRMTLTGEVKN